MLGARWRNDGVSAVRVPPAGSGRLLLTCMAVAIAAQVMFSVWIVLHVSFFNSHQFTDVPVYQHYGDAIKHGEVPYRDFTPEYPPGALPVFAAPAFADLGDNRAAYQLSFEVLMLLVGVATLGCMAFILRHQATHAPTLLRVLVVASLTPLALGSVGRTHFDAWPALLTVASLAAVISRRPLVAGAVLGVAVAAKLYPIVLLPLVLIFFWRVIHRRAAVHACSAFIVGAGGFFIPFAIIGAGGLWSSLHRQLFRPLEIESLGASLLIATDHVLGKHVSVVTDFGSQNISGGVATTIARAQTVVLVLALVVISRSFARADLSTDVVIRYWASCIAVVISLANVFSPQYLIWLVPLVLLVPGRRGRVASVLLLIALGLTQLWFPHQYTALVFHLAPFPSALVLARNLVMLGLVGVLMWRQPQARRTSTVPLTA